MAIGMLSKQKVVLTISRDALFEVGRHVRINMSDVIAFVSPGVVDEKLQE